MVVVGGGAAGTLAAVALLRETDAAVQIVERSTTFGPGLAYGTREPLHLLNNYAGRLSAFGDDPDHFVRWCAEHDLDVGPHSFAPRAQYGWYLSDVLARAEAASPSRVTRVQGEAVDVGDTGGEYVVTLSTGHVLMGDVVVLALGTPPPRRLPRFESLGRRYVHDPWTPDLVDRVHDGARVLLVGSGLTMVDVAVVLAEARPRAQLVSVSRHGLLPAPHVPRGPRAIEPLAPASSRLAALLREVTLRIRDAEQRGGDWRDVVDAVRPVANQIWHALTAEDRERFLRHVARRWEVARHRMAPAMAERIETLVASGQLRIDVTAGFDESGFDVVINCAGPAPVATPGWSLLVDHLVVRGVALPDRLGLGLDVDGSGALIGERGVARAMYAVGAARRGDDWEVAAVPDLRHQAAALAEHLAAGAHSKEVAG